MRPFILLIMYLNLRVDISFEIDDTKDNERLFTSHRTGTSQEIDKDGTQVNIIKGDHYNIVSGKRQAVIEGNADINNRWQT